MDLTKIISSFTNLTTWIKTGLATKQSKVTVIQGVIPSDGDGEDGDVCFVIDA